MWAMLHHTLRASRVVVGLVLIVVGVVLSLPFVPGPGFVCIFLGVTVLGGEFEWARRLRDRMHDGIRRVTGRTRHGE